MAQVGIFVGTVYGNSLLVAEEAQNILSRAMRGQTVRRGHAGGGSLSSALRAGDHLHHRAGRSAGQHRASVPAIRDRVGYQPELRYGLIALGDSSYDNFCCAGAHSTRYCKSRAPPALAKCWRSMRWNSRAGSGCLPVGRAVGHAAAIVK